MSDSVPPGKDKTPASPSQLLEWFKVLLIPILLGVIGYFFTSWQKERDNAFMAAQKERDNASMAAKKERDNIETNVRLYTQLISQREQSDSQLRTEMFKAVIEKFLSGGKTGDLRDT